MEAEHNQYHTNLRFPWSQPRPGVIARPAKIEACVPPEVSA
jgi:hypothetical protein